MANIYYSQLIVVVSDYLGPASERFVNRQIEIHLEKNPEDLTKEDIKKLAEWIRAPLSFLTNDKTVVDSAVKRVYSVVN